MAESKGTSDVTERSPKDELRQAFQQLMTAMAGRAMSGATDRVGGVTNKLSGLADGAGPAGKAVEKVAEKTAEGESPAKAGLSAGLSGVKEKVKGAFGKGGGGDKKKSGRRNLKVTNIIEEIDVGAPIDVVFNAWTQFQDWSDFMKKVEESNREEEEQQKIDFKAQVLWSHRSWQGEVIEEVPNERIVWRSKGEKGRVDGAVSFHELAPRLTRVLVVLEYYPQGFMEQTGNLWRAQGRRARLELKHFQRHVMSELMLHPDQLDELEGWRGEIHDGEVTKSHEDAMREAEEQEDEGSEDERDDQGAEGAEDEYDEQSEDEDEEDEGEQDEGEQDEYGDEDAEDEYDEDEDDDEVEDEDEQPSSNGRARRGARTRGR